VKKESEAHKFSLCWIFTNFAREMEDYSYLFKIILIGDANVGKTCLVKRFTKGFFAPSQGPTIGVDFTIRTVEVDGEKVKVGLTFSFYFIFRDFAET